jgi:hypothetical protein
MEEQKSEGFPLERAVLARWRRVPFLWLLLFSLAAFFARLCILVFASRQLEVRSLPGWERQGIGIVVANRGWQLGDRLLTVDPSWNVSTCFLAAANGSVVTARHAVEHGLRGPWHGVWVRFGASRWLRARIVWLDPDHDLAILRVDPTELAVNGVRPLPLADPIPGLIPGSEETLVGFPHQASETSGFRILRHMVKNRLVYLRRWVLPERKRSSDRAGEEIELFRGVGGPGFSGSPVLDKTGRVVGLYFGHWVSPGGEPLAAAVPVEAFRRLCTSGEL